MLKTWTLRRPTVVFDAANQSHREAFYEFFRRGTWGGCKFNFVLEEPYSDLITNIHYKITDWYMQREFDKDVISSSRTVKVKQIATKKSG
jgi:hypothetical protein